MMPIDTTDHSLEIHLQVGDTKVTGIVFGQGYNPDVYNDLIAQTLNAYRKALGIAVDHGYTFPTTDDEDDEDDSSGDND